MHTDLVMTRKYAQRGDNLVIVCFCFSNEVIFNPRKEEHQLSYVMDQTHVVGNSKPDLIRHYKNIPLP